MIIDNMNDLVDSRQIIDEKNNSRKRRETINGMTITTIRIVGDIKYIEERTFDGILISITSKKI